MSDTTATQFDSAALLRVLSIVRRLAEPFELNEVLTAIIDSGRELFHADRGSVFLYDDTTRELYSTVATGVTEIRFSIDQGLAGESARERNIVNVPVCYADPRFNQEIDLKTGYRTNSLITIPLIGLEDELVGVMQLLNPSKGRFDEADEQLAALLASQAAVAIQRARLLEERLVKMRLQRDLSLARTIQRGVLPKQLPSADGYDMAAMSRPTDETGGDIYDVVDLKDAVASYGTAKMMLLLADATGHGIGSALSVTPMRAMLRIGLRLSADIDQLFTHINRQLCSDLADNRFITAFLGILDTDAHLVDYYAAGQGPLLHFHASDQSCEWIGATTIPLGILEEPPVADRQTIYLAPSDMLVLLTDGFYEYQNAAGKQLGETRIGEVVVHHHREPAQATLDALLECVREYAHGAPQLDDLTALIIKRHGGA